MYGPQLGELILGVKGLKYVVDAPQCEIHLNHYVSEFSAYEHSFLQSHS